ncbi:YfiT family bacillithiol transferase [Flavobacterium sp.]|uniref:YfiT family bacillithiol transferase n=1 Tax=Flavobacterium sp. TaxID=239 RepID=UPI003D131542
MQLENLKFPIGTFEYNPNDQPQPIQKWLDVLREFPQHLETSVQDLTPAQMHWRYRPDGWAILQVVHHCADSHMNSFTRFKLALTEENPVIRPYEEHLWANMSDELTADVSSSMAILKGVHQRWVYFLERLSPDEWQKTFVHPASQKTYTLVEALGLYAWHCAHHLAHIHQAIAHQGEFGSLENEIIR